MNKKLISMLLVGAAFTACTDDEFVDGYSNNQQISGDLTQDLILSVSMDADAESRAAYAGSSSSVFSNFYLEPEFNGTDLALSNQTELKGDMLGFCLTNGANAITNLPFYIAGYGSAKDSVMYVFDDQATGSTLYDLGLDLEDNNQVAVQVTKDLIEESVDSIKLYQNFTDVDLIDVRKGVVRSNAGVMTGKYVAYFPYNSKFTEPAGVPIVALTKAIEDRTQGSGESHFASTEAAAVDSAKFYSKLFAVSKTALDVNGGTKAGKVSLSPRTGAIMFKLYNTAEENEKPAREIKRITVETVTPEATDFILEGTVPMNDLTKVVATKTTDLIGVAFNPDSVKWGTDYAHAKYVMMPVYPNNTKKVKITIYTTDGKAAESIKSTYPRLGAVAPYKLNIDSLDFKPVTRKIFTEQDFLDEMGTDGELELMDDINVTLTENLEGKLNIKGAKTLTINADGNKITATSLTLKDAAGSKLVLNGFDAANVADSIIADTLILASDVANNFINATKVEVNATKSLTLAEANITSLINNGTVTVTNADKKNIVVGTFDNKKTATISATGTLTATTFNNNAGATLTTEMTGSGDAAKYGKLAATTINNAAGTTTPVVLAAVITNNGILVGTINNAGTITWGTQAVDVTISNTGSLELGSACKFTGSLTNTGTVRIDNTVNGDGGSIVNNTNGQINVTNNGELLLNTTTLAINAGTVKVAAEGLINGSSRITVAQGADYIKSVEDEHNFTAVLGTEGVWAKFTGVELAPTSSLTIQSAVSTAKKLFISNADVTFAKEVTLTSGLESTQAVTFTLEADITGDILAEGALTFNDTTSVTGNIDAKEAIVFDKLTTVVGDVIVQKDATFNGTSTLTGNMKIDGTVELTASNLKITKDLTIAESKSLTLAANSKIAVSGKVIGEKNASFTKNNAVITCSDLVKGVGSTWNGEPLN